MGTIGVVDISEEAYRARSRVQGATLSASRPATGSRAQSSLLSARAHPDLHRLVCKPRPKLLPSVATWPSLVARVLRQIPRTRTSHAVSSPRACARSLKGGLRSPSGPRLLRSGLLPPRRLEGERARLDSRISRPLFVRTGGTVDCEEEGWL